MASCKARLLPVASFPALIHCVKDSSSAMHSAGMARNTSLIIAANSLFPTHKPAEAAGEHVVVAAI